MIELAKIRTDGGTQSRAEINGDTVADYAEAMRDPLTVFPPVIVYYDGRSYWLADGFHRVEAWREVGRVEVPAEVRQGDRRQAILHSCAANAAHGQRRTNADKRRAVRTLLEDDEWSQWSDSEIARRCAVSHTFVSKLREKLTYNVASEPRTYTTRHGTDARMNTANIGGSKPEHETPPTSAEGDTLPDAVASGASGGGIGRPAPAPDATSITDNHERGAYAREREEFAGLGRAEIEVALIEARRKAELLEEEVRALAESDDRVMPYQLLLIRFEALEFERDEIRREKTGLLKKVRILERRLAQREKAEAAP